MSGKPNNLKALHVLQYAHLMKVFVRRMVLDRGISQHNSFESIDQI